MGLTSESARYSYVRRLTLWGEHADADGNLVVKSCVVSSEAVHVGEESRSLCRGYRRRKTNMTNDHTLQKYIPIVYLEILRGNCVLWSKGLYCKRTVFAFVERFTLPNTLLPLVSATDGISLQQDLALYLLRRTPPFPAIPPLFPPFRAVCTLLWATCGLRISPHTPQLPN